MKKWATWGPEFTLSDYGLCILQQRHFDMKVLYQTRATISAVFLISSCRRDVNAIFFVFGDSPASDFFVDVSEHCYIFIGGMNKKNN